jgi:signal transduction histidine kinase
MERRRSSPLVALLAAGMLFALFLANVLTLATIRGSRGTTARARQLQSVLSRASSALLDAEIGQRGYLLTGRLDYLEPFNRAVSSLPPSLAEAKRLTADDPTQQRDLKETERLARLELDELRRSIDLYQRGQVVAAMAVVRSSQGKIIVDGARRAIDELRVREDQRLEERIAHTRRRWDLAMWIDFGAGLGLVALGFILFSINRDIGRREVLERALRESAAFQEQFVGILGHDLGNPLAAISMATATLQRREALTDRQAVTVGRIAASTQRMIRMVSQLLDLTRARLAGGIPVQPKPDTDLRDVVAGAIEELHTAHPEAELRLEAAERVRGPWDPDRLAQVVSNLVANAILYGVGPVAVRVMKVDTLAVLEVHNGGPPIPAEILPRLFEAFHGSAAAAGRPAKGLGLGLFIAERIVAAHDGEIDVHSAEGDGTTFTIKLPSKGRRWSTGWPTPPIG